MATDDKVLLLNCIVNIRILMIHEFTACIQAVDGRNRDYSYSGYAYM